MKNCKRQSCGKLFDPKNKLAEYCSAKCRTYDGRERKMGKPANNSRGRPKGAKNKTKTETVQADSVKYIIPKRDKSKVVPVLASLIEFQPTTQESYDGPKLNHAHLDEPSQFATGIFKSKSTHQVGIYDFNTKNDPRLTPPPELKGIDRSIWIAEQKEKLGIK
jgi:hypothetical protein